jgi:hypothetical protein
VFIAFEYDFSQAPRANSRRSPDSIVTRPPASNPQGKGRETIFDAGLSAGASTIPRKVLPVTAQQHRQFPQGQRTVPLSSPYSAAEYDEMTPTLTPGSGKGQGAGKGPVNELPIREEEEDLDPFRRSLVDDEEAQVAVATRVGVGVNNTRMNLPVSGHVARPSLVNVGLGHGHRKTSSGGGTVMATGMGKGVGGQTRMMTSTQELNMKSQFLMNMRPYGVEDSQASEMESTGASARFGSSGLAGSGSGSGMVKDDRNEDSLSEGEESQLGPGSDFFK